MNIKKSAKIILTGNLKPEKPKEYSQIMYFGRPTSKFKDSKIALDSRIEVHDKSQFEVKFEYNFLRSLSKNDIEKDKKYSIETYFFIPKNIGISAINYSKSQFYNDLHAYIRFKTPEMTFNELNDENNIHSPLLILKNNLEKMKKESSEEIDFISINEAKLFGCLINGFLKQSTIQIRKLINQVTYYKNLSSSHGFIRVLEREIKIFINDALSILYKYRNLRVNYQAVELQISPNVLLNLKLVDEYNTYRLENSFASIYHEVENLSSLKNIDCRTILDFLTQVAFEESQYRIQQGFICFKNSTSVNYEYYAYRFGAIKKHIFQVLYLDIRHIKNEKKYRNYMAMAGAAIAALFYLPAQALLTVNANISFSVIFMVVVAYMFKDRVKEVSREILLDKILDKFYKFFPDNDLFIQDYTQDKDDKNRNIIGRCKEYMRFLKKDELEYNILKLRNQGHVVDTDEERSEEVIYYNKDVYLNSQKIINAHHRRTNIKDIIRFNINEFLDKLDNATGKINFFDIEKSIFSSLKAPKVYHLNIIFKYTMGDKKANNHVYQRIRVVLDKNGIVRLEEVIPRCKIDLETNEIIEEKSEEELFSYKFDPENESIFDNVNL